MRLFPTDWQEFLDELAAWGELSIPARRAFLDGTAPGLSVESVTGDAAVDELANEGFLEDAESPGFLAIAERYVPFHQVLKSLEKYPLFESPGLATLCSYLSEHYTPQERSQLHESLALLPNDLARIAGFVSSVEWLQSALTRKVRSTEMGDLETARALLSFFTEQRDRVPLRDMEEYVPVGREKLCDALRLGVQRAVFFLGLRRMDLEPLVGVWPPASRRLRRLSVVLAPEPVTVAQTFYHPFLVEDMTTLLGASLVAPIPIRRGDEKPFSRYIEEASAALLTLPDWLEGLIGLSLESRIDLALQALRLTGLLVQDDHGSGGASLIPGSQAAEWMHRPLADRRGLILPVFAGTHGRQPRLLDLMEEEWTTGEAARDEIAPWITQSFSSVPETSFIRFSDFAEYQAAIGSPLAASASLGSAAAGGRAGETATSVHTESHDSADLRAPSGHPAMHDSADLRAPSGLATEEALEELWKSFLGIFLGRCLLSLGGAEAGVTAEGRPCFRMTDTGRLLLGLPRDGLPDPEESNVDLIVQPNYEVVFLSPSPGAEAELGRFCERVGREVGVLFRITRQSVERAAHAGMTADAAISVLARGSKSPLPVNVVQEMRGWMGAPPV